MLADPDPGACPDPSNLHVKMRTLWAVGSPPAGTPPRVSTRTWRSAAAASGGSTWPALLGPPSANLQHR